MEVKSSAFGHQKPIPKKYTCQGEDVSPPLRISNVPSGTKSLAIIVDDPDAPSGVFDHWIAWNIPGNITDLPEAAPVPNKGKNHFGALGYRGPCPPPGKVHHYRFKVYALDTLLKLPEGIAKARLEEAMKGHILEQTELVGTYER